MHTDLRRLSNILGDRLLTPAHVHFDATSQVFMNGPRRTPQAIAQVTAADEIAAVLAISRARGIRLAVHGAGHSYARHGLVDAGLVLDLRLMNQVEIDMVADIGHAQGGASAGRYTATAAAHGLATGFGDTAGVGVAGLALGGGIGFLSRRHGLTIDEMVGADITLADGSNVRADSQENPELFWALRGGGGNFGVVTGLDFRLHRLPLVTGGLLAWSADAATVASVLEIFAQAPDELSGIVNVMLMPPAPMLPTEIHGRPGVLALVCHAGPSEKAMADLAPLRALGPLVDTVNPTAYPAMFDSGPPVWDMYGASRTGFIGTGVESPGLAWAETAIDVVKHAPGAPAVINLRPMGGAIARVDTVDTAFAHRDAAFMVTITGLTPHAGSAADATSWTTTGADSLGITGPGYVNFMSTASPADVRSAYPGATFSRLRKIKRAYDPDNVFSSNHNIEP